jgi:HPt (histidine-containing phosphotransfer) domain-containing protein
MQEERMINNVNMESGLARSAGLKDIYIETLEAFVEDGSERMNDMKKSLDDNNLDNYSIHVHGIKSALYIIGADEMSQRAQDLETASSNGDADFVNSHNDEFIKALTIMVDDVQNYLNPGTEVPETEPEPESMESLMTELKNALDINDSILMSKTISKLVKMSNGTDNHAAFRKISNYIMVCDYEQAIELLEILI